MKTYTNKEVAAITGLSPRLVQFYTKEGVVVPESGGGKRGQALQYTERNLLDFGIIRELVSWGMNLSTIRWFLEEFRKPSLSIMDRYYGGVIDTTTGEKKNAYILFYRGKSRNSVDSIQYDPNGEGSLLKRHLTSKKLSENYSILIINIGRIFSEIEKNK